MGLSATLYSGISGLQGNATAMSVIGNNISNSNTIGFKSSSSIFSDVLASTIASSSGTSQVGRGVEVSSVKTDFAQGSFMTTSSATDLSIEGTGFFMVTTPTADQTLYTRNGAFTFDNDGYLVNAEGYRVLGRAFNSDGSLSSGSLTPIHANLNTQIPAKMTENVTLATNLDAGSELVGPFDLADPSNTSNYSTPTVVYDSLGNTHTAMTYFTMTAEQTWDWSTLVNSSELDASVAGADELTLVGSGSLVFDSDGELISGSPATTTAGALVWDNDANAGQQITLDFQTTQFRSDSVVISQEQDGYASGELVDVAISTDGIVSASYSNGETLDIATIGLATFSNPDGLVKSGGSLYTASTESGEPSIGTPGVSQGYLYTNSLELSNVDLAQEFVNMVTIQNGYSACSKVITTTDEMLQELINMKR